MTVEECMSKSRGRVSFICLRAADLRRGKTVAQLNQRQAFIQANVELSIICDAVYRQMRKRGEV